MKNNLILFFGMLILVFTSCEEQIEPGVNYEPVTFESLDQNGGTWKPILLTNIEQFSIPEPKNPSSSEFKSEIEEVIKNFNNEPKAINYWGNNPLLKWNEIARELGAKYNLPPAPNDKGIYVLPSPSNPGSYPFFPFAHPPYMSRAFAYLSIAQYDALVVAWHFKYRYNQSALHKLDNRVKTVFEPTDLPSYPSDGAVVAAVSEALLSVFFPLEVEMIKQKSEELKRCLIASGINTKDDIAAGELIGKEVAKIFLQRAASDGMNRAQAPLVVSDSLANLAYNRFGWQWQNLESPKRPVGIAPLFGNVKPWFVANIVSTRPSAPPAIGSAEFNTAADELKNIQANLTKEQRKIANWWSDGAGTYTPPGHWNRRACDQIVKSKFSPLRSARVLAYMNGAIQDAGISCWDTKYYYNYPRPINAIKNFKTILGTPNFPAYTSGHSTFSSAAATVLSAIFPDDTKVFVDWAEEASSSRVYGGIHFRFDCTVGLTQGRNVAQHALVVASKDGSK
jgi:PAP2 superfamily